MIDYTAIGRLIAEEVTNEPGICFYPASFKPPHKGHYKAAKDLVSRNYVTELVIIISRKPKEGITPEESLKVWRKFFKADPTTNIKLRIAQADSPVEDIFNYLSKHVDISAIYVAGGDDEKDDQAYLADLRNKYPNIVKTISIHEKDGRVNSYYVRETLRNQDYEAFKTTIPEAAYNKGYAPDLFKMLSATIEPAAPEEEPKAQPAPTENEPEQA